MNRFVALLPLAFASSVACSTVDRPVGEGGTGGSSTTSASTGGTGTSSATDTGTGTGTGGAAISLKDACTQYATELCNRYDKCAHPVIELGFPDFNACIARYDIYCHALAEATDSNWKPADIKSCADILPAAACPDVTLALITGGPKECIPPAGNRADGATCGNNAQCQSGYCNHTGISLCGVCGPRVTEGGACDAPQDCAAGLACLNSTCTQAGSVGATCVQGQMPCVTGLVCNGGTCTTPLGPGASCTPGEGLCDLYSGVLCSTVDNVCEPPDFAQPGSQCGNIGATGITMCAGAGVCYTPPTTGIGSCVAPAPDGQSCDSKKGPGCVAPALCIGSVCTLPASCD